MKRAFYSLVVVLLLAGSLLASAVPGCHPTGFYQVVRYNGRVMLATDTCQAFYYLGVQNANYQFYKNSVQGGPNGWQAYLTTRYGTPNFTGPWATHTLQRFQAAYFNAIGDYGIGPLYNATTPTRYPFIFIIKPSGNALRHPENCGLSAGNPIKNLLDYVTADTLNNVWALSKRDPIIDAEDPAWPGCTTYEIQTGWPGTIGNFYNSKWVIGITVEDADDLWWLRAQGNPYIDTSMVALASNPAGTTGTGCNGSNTCANYTKAALVTYLQSIYASIGALNAKWNSTYTTWGSSGGTCAGAGWPKKTCGGTGLLDEDGSSPWLPEPYLLTGGTAQLATDMLGFETKFTTDLFSQSVTAIKAFDTHHLIFGMNDLGGGASDVAKNSVLDGMKVSGLSALHVKYDPVSNGGSNDLALSIQVYDRTQLPAFSWYGVAASNGTRGSCGTFGDNYWHDQCPISGNYDGTNFGCPCANNFDATYATQAARGAQYSADLSVLYNARSSNNTLFILGVNFWGQSDDNPGESANFGFISNNDNLYDGHCAVIAASTDQWGIPCGGETANYGDFFDSVAAANQAALQRFNQQIDPPSHIRRLFNELLYFVTFGRVQR